MSLFIVYITVKASSRTTVHPLYNSIRYNSKIRYNVNLVCTNISGSCIFFIDIPMLFFRKTYVFVYLLESPQRGDSNTYTKRMIHKKTVQKYPLLMLLTGPQQVSL